MTLDVLQQRPATSCGKTSHGNGGSLTGVAVVENRTSATKLKLKSPAISSRSSKHVSDSIPERSDDDDDGDNHNDDTHSHISNNSSKSSTAIAKRAPPTSAVPATSKPILPKVTGVDRTLQLTNMLRSEEAKLSQQLLVASEKGNKHAAYLLLHQGIDIARCKGMSGYSPLHYAATRGHLDVLQLLLDAGWPVDALNDLSETPLHLAAYHGHVPTAECLLDRGANVNALTSDAETPLFYAARKSHYRVVRLLIRRECDLTLTNRFGDVAEDDATHEKTRVEFVVGRTDAKRLDALLASDSASSSSSSSSSSSEQRVGQTQRELILSFLDLASLCRASQVSYRWHRAADNPSLWRRLGVSRWELLLSATMGLGAVSTMGMGIGGLRLKLSSSKTIVAASTRRPTSCDQSYSNSTRFDAVAAVGLNFTRKSSTTSGMRRVRNDDLRPQTARLCGSGY